MSAHMCVCVHLHFPLQEVKLERPLELKFQRGHRRQAEEVASTRIQANWKGQKARAGAKAKRLPQIEARLRVGEGEILKAVAEAEASELGFELECWPPAPRVLLRLVRSGSWARGVGMREGDELLTVQGQSLQEIDRRRFQQLLDKTRPLEITFCRGTKEDTARIASAKAQAGWRKRSENLEGEALDTGEQKVQQDETKEKILAMSETSQGASQHLEERLAERDRELKALRQEFSKAEAVYQTSLREISADSSNSAVELASLKAQLAVEQSKACPP